MTLRKKITSFSILITGLMVVAFGVSQFVGSGLVFGDAVNVTASVDQTVSCTTDVSSTDFGQLTTGSISTASPNAVTTLSCNSSGGCTLNVNDAGDGASNAGLYNSTTTELIASQTETLAAGSEGYGIQAATSTAGSGGTLSIAATYDKSGNDVGALQTTATQLATAGEPISNREVDVTHKAAISGNTASGAYADTLTYSCTAN